MIRNLLKNLLGDSFNESNEKYAKINLGIIILMFVVSAIMLFFLPSEIDICIVEIRIILFPAFWAFG